jgi:hypothetical protein
VTDSDLRAALRAHDAEPTSASLSHLLSEAARGGRAALVRPDGGVTLDPPAGVEDGMKLIAWDATFSTGGHQQMLDFADLGVVVESPIVLGRLLLQMYSAAGGSLLDPGPSVQARVSVERCPGETVVRIRYLKPDPEAEARLAERIRVNREAAERERTEGLATGRFRVCFRCERLLEIDAACDCEVYDS